MLTETGRLSTGLGHIGMVELATGKSTEVLRDPQHNLFNPYYSWDDKWMAFLMQTGGEYFRIYVTPVENYIPAGPDRWIQLTSGEYHDDKEQFSPDGNTMYFTSNRDGATCIWALRLDPKTKRPLGAPFRNSAFSWQPAHLSRYFRDESHGSERSQRQDRYQPRRVSHRHLDDATRALEVGGQQLRNPLGGAPDVSHRSEVMSYDHRYCPLAGTMRRQNCLAGPAGIPICFLASIIDMSVFASANSCAVVTSIIQLMRPREGRGGGPRRTGSAA